jgi:hypothetical protein
MGVIQGFVRLREKSLSILRSLKMSEADCQELAQFRPRILVSINDVCSPGHDREKLKQNAESRGAYVLRRDAEFWSRWPGKVGKHAHLVACRPLLFGAGVLMTDVELSSEFVVRLYEEHVLGGLGYDSLKLTFWSSRSDGLPHTVLFGEPLLDDGRVLSLTNEYYTFHGRRCLFGGIKVRRWRDRVPPGQFSTKRLKIERRPASDAQNSADYSWSMQNLIYSFIHTGAAKVRSLQIVESVI